MLIFTDIHGDLDYFTKAMKLWDEKEDIVFTGDLIHNYTLDNDESLTILDTVAKYMEYPNFHCLMGNHELSQLKNDITYKYSINQSKDFLKLIHTKSKTLNMSFSQCKNYYYSILEKFRYFLKTDNIFIAHAGVESFRINEYYNGDVDINNLNLDNIKDYRFLSDQLWARPYDDYSKIDIDRFLETTGCDYMIVGHSPYTPCHIYGNQLILDSSISEDKYYLKIDLNRKYKDIIELTKECVFKIR